MAFSDWDFPEKLIGGTGAGAGAIYLFMKLMTFWKNESNNQASASATTAQFDTLRTQIKAQDERITANDAKTSLMLVELQRQDGVIHRQATKLTRIEMLARQLIGLIQDNSVSVPVHIQKELDDLIKMDRDPEARTRASDAT